jgi:hypothetical protein
MLVHSLVRRCSTTKSRWSEIGTGIDWGSRVTRQSLFMYSHRHVRPLQLCFLLQLYVPRSWINGNLLLNPRVLPRPFLEEDSDPLITAPSPLGISIGFSKSKYQLGCVVSVYCKHRPVSRLRCARLHSLVYYHKLRMNGKKVMHTDELIWNGVNPIPAII